MMRRCSNVGSYGASFRVTSNPSVFGVFPVKFYKPGDWVPYSGIYRVIHHEHLYAHEVTSVSGERFPECRQCRSEVRFALLSAARSIKKHAMFASDPSRRGDAPNAHDLLENKSDPIRD